MTRNIFTYVLGFCLALVLITPVVAQRVSGGDGSEMLRAAIEQTDQLIDRSQGVIRASGSEPAIKALEQAINAQHQAWDRFHEATLVGYAAAKNLTMTARDLVRLALRLVSPGQDGNELQDGAVQRKLDQADDKLDRAREVLNQADNSSLDALYQGARNNLDQAWEFYRSKQYRPALKLADQVQLAAEKIIAMAGESSLQGGGNLDRRLDNVSQLVDQVQQVLQDCQSGSARELMSQAKQSLDLARSLDNRQQAGALQALKTARDLALKAERICRGNVLLEQRYNQLKTRLDRLTEQANSLTGSTRDATDRLIAQAREQLTLARGFLDQGQPERAQAALQAAHLAIQQAAPYVGQGK
jgi:hypothetical protein